MAPHMKYGEAVPNHDTGRPYGIIETRKLIRVLDGIRLIRSSDHWTGMTAIGVSSTGPVPD